MKDDPFLAIARQLLAERKGTATDPFLTSVFDKHQDNIEHARSIAWSEGRVFDEGDYACGGRG